MKKLNYLLVFILLGLSACSVLTSPSKYDGDDTYYSLSDVDQRQKAIIPEYQVIQRAGDGSSYHENSSQNPNAGNGNTYQKYEKAEEQDNPRYESDSQYSDESNDTDGGIVNNYYGDYYSANYSRKWRQFNDPYIALNYGGPIYFNPVYSPFYSGISVGFGYGYGYGSPNFGYNYYDPFYDPFFNSYFYPSSYNAWCYNPYRYGYNNYHHGLYNNFYSNYDPYYSNFENKKGSNRVYNSSRQNNGSDLGGNRNRPMNGNENSRPIIKKGNNNSIESAPTRNTGNGPREQIRENPRTPKNNNFDRPTERPVKTGKVKDENRMEVRPSGEGNNNGGGNNSSSPNYSSPSRSSSSGSNRGSNGGGNSGGGSNRVRPR